MPEYRYIVTNWSDDKPKDELPLSDIKYGHILNRPGGFSGTMPKHHIKATKENLDVNRTFLYVERGGIIRWGGILWTVQVQSNTLQLGAEGFLSYFNRRKIRETLQFLGFDQFDIARSLINYAQVQLHGDIGVTLPSGLSGVVRDRTYHGYERKNLGEVLVQLSEVINGFDFAIDPYWSNNEIIKPLTLHYPQRGRASTNMLFEFGTNIVGYDHYVDGKKQVNVIDSLGAGENDSMLIATASDLDGAYPRLEEDFAHRDVSRLATLQEKSDVELMARKHPATTLGIKVRNTNSASIGDWVTGDVIRIKIDDYWTQIDDWYRILEWNVSVSEENAEEIDFGLAPATASLVV